MLFVTERPYLPPGTLRELFLKPHPERLDDGHGPLDAQALAMPESRIRSSLKTLGLGRLVQRSGGLDVSRDWDSSLSLEEQQLLVIARALACRPQFIFLDRPETSLPPAAIDRVMQALKEQNMTHITFAKDDADGQPDIGRLELITGGKWRWQAGNNGQPT